MTDEPLAHIRHAKALGYCAKGLREFFKNHGLDYLQFVRVGIPERLIWDTNDELARRIVIEARRERGDL
jgi:hypothetical protein